jgi:hypothetical protein
MPIETAERCAEQIISAQSHENYENVVRILNEAPYGPEN